MRYLFIQKYRGQFALSALCRVMAVCRSGFYTGQKRPTSPRALENENLTQQIRVLYQESDQTYGSPRVHKDLKALGLACSEKRVARLMRLEGLKAVLSKRFVVTTDSDHELPIAANLLDRQFGSETPDRRSSSNINKSNRTRGQSLLN